MLARRLVLVLLIAGCPADPGDSGGESDSATGESATTTAPATTSDPTTSDPTGSDTGDDDSAVWNAPYCRPVKDGPAWPPAFQTWEEQVLALVNEARALGHDCDTKGKFGPAPPLTMNASLRCAARKHAADMSTRNFFDHVNPDGEDPFDRIAQAGYGSYNQAGENIAGGSDSPEATVAGWLESDGHCGNLMSPGYTEIGVGAYEGLGDYTFYWTQTFGG